MEDKRTSAKKRLVAQYKAVFGSPEGRSVLKDLCKSACLVSAATVHVPGDTEATFMNIGKQDLMKKVLIVLEIDPEEFFKQAEQQEASHV